MAPDTSLGMASGRSMRWSTESSSFGHSTGALLGGEKYKNRWLLSPDVIRRMFTVTGFGSQMDDLNDKSTMLGGAMIVSKQGVVFAEAETSGFTYPSAAKLLEALEVLPPKMLALSSDHDAK